MCLFSICFSNRLYKLMHKHRFIKDQLFMINQSVFAFIFQKPCSCFANSSLFKLYFVTEYLASKLYTYYAISFFFGPLQKGDFFSDHLLWSICTPCTPTLMLASLEVIAHCLLHLHPQMSMYQLCISDISTAHPQLGTMTPSKLNTIAPNRIEYNRITFISSQVQKYFYNEKKFCQDTLVFFFFFFFF